MKKMVKQLGQGMTEYIIIVALIAIAAIGIYSLFGDTIREQMGDMTTELAGGTATTGDSITVGAQDDARTLEDFETGND